MFRIARFAAGRHLRRETFAARIDLGATTALVAVEPCSAPD